jgi:putative transposase
MLSDCGTEPLRLPPRSPNLNAYCERLRPSSIIIMKSATNQGLDNQVIDPALDVGHGDGTIRCRERLGGILRYYFRQAA